MSTINDGGPAFPVLPPVGPDGTSAVGYPYVSDGMTLRDYFAAKAMEGMLTDLPKSMYGLDWMRSTAVAAYKLADEMLFARGQQ